VTCLAGIFLKMSGCNTGPFESICVVTDIVHRKKEKWKEWCGLLPVWAVA
jgi:hypothetical protein